MSLMSRLVRGREEARKLHDGSQWSGQGIGGGGRIPTKELERGNCKLGTEDAPLAVEASAAGMGGGVYDKNARK